MEEVEDMLTQQSIARSQLTGGAAKHRPLVYGSELLDRPVVGRQGEHLGVVDDLVVETRGGSIAFVILKYRVDNKRFVLPYGSIRFDPQHQRVCVDVSREVFDLTPGMAGSRSD